MDDEQVQILIDAKNESAAAFAEARSAVQSLKDGIAAYNRAVAEGAAAQEAMKRATNGIAESMILAGATIDATRAQVSDLRHAMELYFEVVAAGTAPEEAFNIVQAQMVAELDAATAAAQANAAAMTENAAATEGDAAATDTASTSILGFVAAQTAAMVQTLAMPAAIAVLVAALFPLVALLTAGATIFITWSAAAVGAVAIMGAISVGFLGLGGIALLFANAFGTAAKETHKLGVDIKALGENFAKIAAPEANQILKFIDHLLPLVRAEGDGILSWFGARLPNALTSMRVVIRDLLPDINNFGKFLGGIFDKLAPSIGPLFEQFARFGLGAIQGLVGNLAALEQWFVKRLPSFGPVVSQVFGGIGSAVQAVAGAFGKLTDFFVKEWPSIKGNWDAFSKGISEGWNAINKAFGGPGSVDWQGFFHGLGVAIGGAAAAISDFARAFGIIFSQVVAALPVAWNQITSGFVSDVNGFIGGINDLLAAINNLPAPVKTLLGLGSVPSSIPYMSYASGSLGSSQPSPGRQPGGKGGGKAKTNVTINVHGNGDPSATAQATSRAFRRITAT